VGCQNATLDQPRAGFLGRPAAQGSSLLLLLRTTHAHTMTLVGPRTRGVYINLHFLSIFIMEKEAPPVDSQLPVYVLESKDALLSLSLTPRRKRTSLCLRLFVLFIGFCLSYGVFQRLSIISPFTRICVFPVTSNYDTRHVGWKSCGEGIEGYDCANITVGLP
jgi:hypothetical protein